MTDPERLKGKLPDLAVAGVCAEDVRAFCDATGDDNAIHRDVEAVRSFGLDRILVPGMLLSGLFSRAIAGWDLQGRTAGMQVRFLNPLHVDSPFVIEGRVMRLGADGMVVLRLKARDATTIFAVGEVRLARPCHADGADE